MAQSTVQRVYTTVKIDPDPTPLPPSALRVVVATLVSILGSLLSDALLVSVGTAVFRSTQGDAHFQFSDYATLTVIGVAIAGAAWTVVTRVSSSPRRLFLRLAIVGTLLLSIPHVWLLARGQPGDAVVVLMVMHLAVALVTYHSLVRLAPLRPSGADGRMYGSTGNQLGRVTRRRHGNVRNPIIGGFALLMAAFLALTAVLFVWPATDSPQHVDAIVSFNGPDEGAREGLAVSLAEKGYASVLLFSRGGGGKDTSCPSVRGVSVVCFIDVTNNTRGEARFAARYAELHHLKSLMIVPGRPQTTRARLLLERCFPGKIVAVPSAERFIAFPRDVLHEWGGLVEALLIHRGC